MTRTASPINRRLTTVRRDISKYPFTVWALRVPDLLPFCEMGIDSGGDGL